MTLQAVCMSMCMSPIILAGSMLSASLSSVQVNSYGPFWKIDAQANHYVEIAYLWCSILIIARKSP